jgi:predicted SprT family Zn-dependent metalloprotease
MDFAKLGQDTCATLLVPELYNKIEVCVGTMLQTTMGKAVREVKNGEAHYYLVINEKLFKRATEKEKAETVVHEICHLVEMFNYGKVQRIRAGHGPIWENYMRKVGLKPERFHNVDCTGIKRKQNRHIVVCACREHRVSTTKANRILYEPDKYVCRVCSGKLTFKGAE